MKIVAFPKINLALDILGRDLEIGMHQIQTVLHLVESPFDELEVELSDRDIRVFCDKEIPENKNLVYKAALLLQQKAKTQGGANIKIKKNIPLGAGLGGGSSDVAQVLKALTKIWDINDQLAGKLIPEIAQEIGSDCTFFIEGGTALGTHFGEVIAPLPGAEKYIEAEVIETGISISSSWAYANLDLSACGKNLHKTKALIDALREGSADGIIENAHNDFEESTFKKYPELQQKKLEIEKERGGKVLLAGSGGCLTLLRTRVSP